MNICPYLAAVIVAALAWAGDTLVVLGGKQITMITREAFDNMFLKENQL